MKLPLKYWLPGSLIATFIATELTLRLVGLGTPVLLQADPATGYRYQPNQKVFRFGKRVEYNQYSQRSEPITPNKSPGTLRILMTGDSVLNGGNPTDQKQIISEQLEARIASSGKPVEVLNASAGSWGIGNQLGYLQEFGTFDSDAVILQIGTHDLTQPTSTSDPVGRDPNFPTSPPLLAIQELWGRYLLPRVARFFPVSSPTTPVPPPSTQQHKQQFQDNWQSVKAIITLVYSQNIPVFVLFTPDRHNLIPTFNVPPDKPEFVQQLNALGVSVIDTHTAWSTLPTTTVETYFRDGVHLSVAGNQAAADLLFQQLCTSNQLPACANSSHKPEALNNVEE